MGARFVTWYRRRTIAKSMTLSLAVPSRDNVGVRSVTMEEAGADLARPGGWFDSFRAVGP